MVQQSLCGQCFLQGYCRQLESFIVESDELTPHFILYVRSYARALNIAPVAWEPFLVATYRDYPGRIVDEYGEEADLDTDVFGTPSIRTWFRDLCRELPANVKPRLRRESRMRFVVMATILCALDPVRARLWGKEIANDNKGAQASIQPPKLGDCAFRHLSYFDLSGDILF